jgi:UDP-N-acetylmuramate--alanine ligase
VVTEFEQAAHNKQFQLTPGMRFHLVGIGGAGISAIARVLLGRGYQVTGSDQQPNELTEALEEMGATIYQGHLADHVGEVDALVISSAVPPTNPEVMAAERRDIPVLKRADLLGRLMAGSQGIAVAGTHGKTTTTGMLAQILIGAGLDPTVIMGGVLPAIGTNGRSGSGNYFVVEADEYDYMFLGLRPQVIIITNLEHDHPDIFPTMEAYAAAFQQFAALLPAGGSLVTCLDDPGASDLLAKLNLPEVRIITYVLADEIEDEREARLDFQALDCRPNQLGGTDFLLQHDGNVLGLVRLRVPGLYNVRNATAASIVALELGIEFETIRQALAEFGGIGRRFQVVGEAGRVTIIDDYAHHPTEIQVTLAAARQRFPGRRIWAVWQPHTFSRTKLLLDEFAASFDMADRVIALDIFRSREQDTLGIDTNVVLSAMNHPYAVHLSDHRDAVGYILDRVHPDDVILTLSAGDGNRVGQWVLDGLKKRLGEE